MNKEIEQEMSKFLNQKLNDYQTLLQKAEDQVEELERLIDATVSLRNDLEKKYQIEDLPVCNDLKTALKKNPKKYTVRRRKDGTR